MTNSSEEITEFQIKRVDLLPPNIKQQLRKLGIVTGLVRYNIKENSPKEIISIEPSFQLPSEVIEQAYNK